MGAPGGEEAAIGECGDGGIALIVAGAAVDAEFSAVGGAIGGKALAIDAP